MGRKGRIIAVLAIFALCMAAVLGTGLRQMRQQAREAGAQMAQNGPAEAMESLRRASQAAAEYMAGGPVY